MGSRMVMYPLIPGVLAWVTDSAGQALQRRRLLPKGSEKERVTKVNNTPTNAHKIPTPISGFNNERGVIGA